MRTALSLGLRTLGREWRSGDLAVLFLALLVAVAALTGVGFLVDRIDRAMRLQASEVLGADLRLVSPDPIGESYAAEATRRGLDSASVVTLLSVVLKDDRTQLANIHAVSEGYPLRGNVRVRDAFGTRCPDTSPDREIGRIRGCSPVAQRRDRVGRRDRASRRAGVIRGRTGLRLRRSRTSH